MNRIWICCLALLALPSCQKEVPEPSASAPANHGPASAAAQPSTSAEVAARVSERHPPPTDLLVPPDDAQRTPTGLLWKRLETGAGGARPSDQDYVDVHYTAWKPDGSVFAASGDNPQRWKLSEQLAGLREALTTMSLGDKRRLWLPYKLAFGSKPTIMNAPKSELVYDVALLKIISPPTPPPNVAAAPPDAKRTQSGLAYRVVDNGTGTRHPGPNSRVSLRFAAFTPDGKMFESSYERGDVTTARLTRLIKGWQEGLQLMVEGERTVFWIPGSLAHGEIKPGVEREPFAPPAGPVVFDVELVEILEP